MQVPFWQVPPVQKVPLVTAVYSQEPLEQAAVTQGLVFGQTIGV
jgi:hypothetical protein